MIEFILRRNPYDKREWSTEILNGFQIKAYYRENCDMFDAALYDKKLGILAYRINRANSLEDVCLQFEHNLNPLNQANWEDEFCVDYERSNSSEIAETIADKLEQCSNTFKKLSNELNQDSITLPKVHVPKKFKSFSI